MTDIDSIELGNLDACVGVQAEDIVFLKPPRRLTKERALVVAAHIVALSGVEEADFLRLLHRLWEDS